MQAKILPSDFFLLTGGVGRRNIRLVMQITPQDRSRVALQGELAMTNKYSAMVSHFCLVVGVLLAFGGLVEETCFANVQKCFWRAECDDPNYPTDTLLCSMDVLAYMVASKGTANYNYYIPTTSCGVEVNRSDLTPTGNVCSGLEAHIDIHCPGL